MYPLEAMSIFSLFRKATGGLICPRCEKPLEGHSEADCARKMSRRWFLGATLGAVAGVVIAPTLPVNPFLTPVRSAYATLGVGNRLVVNFTGTLAELSTLCVIMQNPATGEYHQVEHSVNPLIEQETFYIAPKEMMVADVKWKFATKGQSSTCPILSVVRG